VSTNQEHCKKGHTKFLDNVIKLHVKKEKFTLILDSWEGQTNLSLYDEKFVDEQNESISSLKIPPPNCTTICQLCYVHFYRHVKNYTVKSQNYPLLAAANRKLCTRED
jgi:hypothetical protein